MRREGLESQRYDGSVMVKLEAGCGDEVKGAWGLVAWRVRRGALIYAARVRRGCLQGGRAGANNSLASGSRNHPLLWFFHHPRTCLSGHCCGYLPPSIENVVHCHSKVACWPDHVKYR